MTLRRAGLLAALVMLTGSGMQAQRRALPPGAAIVGQVVDGVTRRELDRVVIELVGVGQRDIRRKLVTDHRGRFLFTGLPDGDYQILATRSGYLNGAFGQRRAAGDASTITLGYGQWINNADIPLWRPGVITGFVTDDVGTPMEGVTVRAFRHERRAGHVSLHEVSSAVTDDTGAYRLASLVPGDHMVGVTAHAEDTIAPMYFPAADIVAGAATVTVDAGRDYTGVHFTIPTVRPHIVSGRIDPMTVPEGSMTAVKVTLARPVDPFVAESKVHRVLGTIVPDDEGRFTFEGVPPGDYVIEASVQVDSLLHWAHEPISVGRTQDESHTLILRPGLSVTGRTRIEAAPSRNVSQSFQLRVTFEPLFETSVEPGVVAPTGANGEFATDQVLQPGRYLVRVLGIPPGWRLRGVTMGGADVSDVGLDLSAGYAPPELLVELTDRTTVITGTVRNEGPLSYNGATVLLFPQTWGSLAARRYHSARTAPDGTFTFRNIPPGNYLMAAIDEADTAGWQVPERLQALAARATRVVLRDGEAKILDLRRVPVR